EWHIMRVALVECVMRKDNRHLHRPRLSERRIAEEKGMVAMNKVGIEALDKVINRVRKRQANAEIAAIEVLNCRDPQHVGRTLGAIEFWGYDFHLMPVLTTGIFKGFHRSRH